MTIEVPVRFGDTRNCVGLSITGDREAEEDESFQVLIEELGVSTTVTIMDDGKLKSVSYLRVIIDWKFSLHN